MNKILLLGLILNGVEVHDVQRDFSRDRRFYEGINVDGYAIGKEQLVHTRRISRQSASQVISGCSWQPFFKVGEPVFKHHFVPRRNVGLFFTLFHLIEALGIQLACEFLIWLPNDTRQPLEIADIKSVLCALDKHLIEERLDDFPLSLFDIIPGKTGEPRRNHVPCSDRLLGIEVSRWCAKGVDAQRQSLGAQGGPNSDLTHVHEFLCPSDIPSGSLQFCWLNPKCQSSKIALRVDDERRNFGERRFFNERLCHDCFSRPRGAKHGSVTGENH